MSRKNRSALPPRVRIRARLHGVFRIEAAAVAEAVYYGLSRVCYAYAMRKQRYSRFNSKRRIAAPGSVAASRLSCLSAAVRYSGNPEHKRSPGDFDLSPPASPRRGKTLCDVANIDRRADAEKLLRRGLEVGAVSVRGEDGWPERGWPQQVWSIDSDFVFEAQRDATGSYHGYPLPRNDPHATAVREWWKANVRD